MADDTEYGMLKNSSLAASKRSWLRVLSPPGQESSMFTFVPVWPATGDDS